MRGWEVGGSRVRGSNGFALDPSHSLEDFWGQTWMGSLGSREGNKENQGQGCPICNR
jgi:hypothetical protein